MILPTTNGMPSWRISSGALLVQAGSCLAVCCGRDTESEKDGIRSQCQYKAAGAGAGAGETPITMSRKGITSSEGKIKGTWASEIVRSS